MVSGRTQARDLDNIQARQNKITKSHGVIFWVTTGSPPITNTTRAVIEAYAMTADGKSELHQKFARLRRRVSKNMSDLKRRRSAERAAGDVTCKEATAAMCSVKSFLEKQLVRKDFSSLDKICARTEVSESILQCRTEANIEEMFAIYTCTPSRSTESSTQHKDVSATVSIGPLRAYNESTSRFELAAATWANKKYSTDRDFFDLPSPGGTEAGV